MGQKMKKKVEKLTIFEIFDPNICFFQKNALSLQYKICHCQAGEVHSSAHRIKIAGQDNKRREHREAISSRFFLYIATDKAAALYAKKM